MNCKTLSLTINKDEKAANPLIWDLQPFHSYRQVLFLKQLIVFHYRSYIKNDDALTQPYLLE